MLRLAVGRQAGGVSRHEGKRCVGILAVFGQVEMHSSYPVPGGMPRLQEILQRLLCAGQFIIQRGIEARPQGGELFRIEIFRTRHGRNIGDQLQQCPLVGRNDSFIFDCRAARRDIARGKIAPPCPHRWQSLPDQRRAQINQPVPRTLRKGG